jgi:hypothetical protein
MTSAYRHKLSLQPSLMTMETYTSESRSRRVPIPFLDFIVDGEALIETVLGNGSDRLPTRLQPEWGHYSLDEQVNRLLGLGAPEYEDGRSAMYICKCGDLFQLVVLILFWVAGKPWELASYLWLATILVALGGLAFLLYVRRNDRPFCDEEEARRAEWDRRGRAL